MPLRSTGGARPKADWDREWQRAWKANPANPWFQYQANEYLGWVEARLAEASASRPIRVLKTDGFDEACGFDFLRQSFDGSSVLMDVSPLILARAVGAVRAAGGHTLACATDVRRLGFRPASFDLVFSPSTLDHFADRRDIAAAFAELHGVLRPGGHLLVALDNPANPILRVRRAIHALVGPIGGLIPFCMGRTLSRARLVDALAESGFEVLQSDYLVHAPRLVGLWLGEWVARRGRPAWALRLHRWLLRWDRLLAFRPLRRWTGHFVVADCRRPQVERRDALGCASAGAPRVIARYGALEHRLRCAYLRMPAPLLARIDPPLGRAVAAVRRALAMPLHLAQELALWSGPCGGSTGAVAAWGKRRDVKDFLHPLLDGEPETSSRGVRSFPAVARELAETRDGTDLIVAETTPALAPWFRHRGFLIVPAAVRLRGVPAALLAVQAKPSNSLQSDLARIRRVGYRSEIWPYTPARSAMFYERYMVPHALARFADHANVPAFDRSDRLFAAGFALAILPPGQGEPDALGVCVAAAGVLWLAWVGVRDGDPALLRSAGLAALYEFLIRFAHERAFNLIDVGYGPPWSDDSLVRYKWKWGFRPAVDPGQTLEYAIKVVRPESAVARRLLERRPMLRAGRNLFPMSPDVVLDPGQETTVPRLRVRSRR